MLAATKCPPAKSTIRSLALNQIQRNNDLQMREHLDEKHVEILANIIQDGDELEGRLPVVFFDGQRNWLADGYHRYAAHEASGIRKMKCEVMSGTFEDAKLFAAAANAKHGKRLDDYGIKKAILTLLAHPFAKWWAAGQIASHIGCSQTYVCKFTDSVSTLVLTQKDIPDQLSDEVKDKICRILEAKGTPRIFTNRHGTWTAFDIAPAKERAAKSKRDKEEPVIHEEIPVIAEPVQHQFASEEPETNDLVDSIGEMIESETEIYRDAKGRICERPEVIEAFKIVPFIRDKLEALQNLYVEVMDVVKLPGGIGIDRKLLLEGFKSAKIALRDGRPYAICPIENEAHKTFDPHARAEPCLFCNNVRWLTYAQYQALQDNSKKLVEEWGKFYRDNCEH